MKKIRAIGYDLDDVLVSFMQEWIPWHNKTYNLSFQYTDFTQFQLHVPVGCSEKEMSLRLDQFSDEGGLRNLVAEDYAKEALASLREKFPSAKFYIITARKPKYEEDTFYSVKKQFPEHDFEVIFTSSKYKSSACIEKKIDLFFEDRIETAVDCAEKGIKTCLLTKPWNIQLNQLPKRLGRINSWEFLI